MIQHVRGNATQLVDLVEDSVRNTFVFSFFPFLLLGLISFIVDRWRRFLLNCLSAVADAATLGLHRFWRYKSVEHSTKLFKTYRYLNVIAL